MSKPRWEHEQRGIYKLDLGALKISLVNGHIHYKDEWIMNCYDIGIKEKVVGHVSMDCERAKDCAVIIVRTRLKSMLQAVVDYKRLEV